jgi:hypothetical protein
MKGKNLKKIKINLKEVDVDGFCDYGTEHAVSVGVIGALTVCQQ